MKYLKTFENVNEPQIGDYVAVEEEFYASSDATDQLFDFTSTHIGKIVTYKPNHFKGENVFCVKYENVPEKLQYAFEDVNLQKMCRNMLLVEIKFWSKNKEDVEEYLASKKYNL